MNKNDLNRNFVNALSVKIPAKSELSNYLCRFLSIDKTAVYRRLRGEVPFALDEVLDISHDLKISLDEVAGTVSSKSRPFYMKFVEYDTPTETDYYMLQEYVDVIRMIALSGYSECGVVTGSIPLHFLVKYINIYRFYILKWNYQSGGREEPKHYSDITAIERYVEINKGYLEAVKDISYTYFIFDELILSYLVNDINYFASIRLITKEEVQLIGEELNQLIGEMEELASKGKYDTDNRIEFYISNLNFETSYTFLQSSDIFLTLIKCYTFNEIASLDEEVFQRMKTWIQSLKRTSVLITESGEIQRIRFFDKQREYIGALNWISG